MTDFKAKYFTKMFLTFSSLVEGAATHSNVVLRKKQKLI